MALPMMAMATLAYAACATNSPSRYTPVEFVRRAERSFAIRLPRGFKVCRGDFQVDTINFVVSSGRVQFLNINFLGAPRRHGAGRMNIDPTKVTDGRVHRDSADGRVETLTNRLERPGACSRDRDEDQRAGPDIRRTLVRVGPGSAGPSKGSCALAGREDGDRGPRSLICVALRPPKLGGHPDLADDGGIEIRQVFGRDPILAVSAASRLLHLITAEERAQNTEAGDIPRAGRRDVPVTGDLDGIVLGQDRIEDRLFRQPWRELLPSRRPRSRPVLPARRAAKGLRFRSPRPWRDLMAAIAR